MKVIDTPLPGVLVVELDRFEDERGWFMESWSHVRHADAGVSTGFVQDNVSWSRQGVLRGLHFQLPPHEQAKLIGVLDGSIFDVAVDLRPDSQTFGRWFGCELSSVNRKQLFIPPGFAHGFLVLSDSALVGYKCSGYYNKDAESAIRWDDPDLGIEWPATPSTISLKDRSAPSFAAYRQARTRSEEDPASSERVSDRAPHTDRRPGATSPPCSICGSTTEPFGSAVVLSRYDVGYWRCTRCGAVRTEPPYWLEEAYQTPLAAIDVGVIARNLVLAARTQVVIQQWFRPDAEFLDFGGGYGILVRLMRDRGFDFRWQDKYATNLVSRGFEAATGSATKFELVTAFELLEHLTDPVAELEAMLRLGSSFLFSTELLPKDSPRPGSWWYYAPQAGQHVTFYTRESLRILAGRLGLNLATDGRNLHLMSKRNIPDALFRFITTGLAAKLLVRLRRRSSLTEQDFQEISARTLP